MAFQVSRFIWLEEDHKVRKVYRGDIGSPYPTRDQAEKKLAETLKMLGLAGHRYEIREVEETAAMRESWIRKGLIVESGTTPKVEQQ